MKMFYFAQALILIIFTTGCSKDSDDKKKKGYGCVFGTNKVTEQKEFIRCGHIDIYAAGYNQSAADKIADQNGLSKEDVKAMENYSNWEFIPNENCDCK